MNSRARLVVAVALCALAFTASADALWEKTRTGMTEAEVLRAIPGVVKNSEPDKVATGALCTMSLGGQPFAGTDVKFKVLFCFRSKKLSQVNLSGERELSYGAGRAAFDGMVEGLRAKYGQERPLSEEGPDSTWNMVGASWSTGQTAINLHLLGFFARTARVYVVYR